MRAALALLLAVTVPAAPPVDEGRITLAFDTEAQWVPFDVTPGNQIRFDATLDGRTLTALLDTGVSWSVLARRYAEAEHLPMRAGRSQAQAVGGAVPIAWARTGRIAIGGLTRNGGTVSVATLPAQATGGSVPVDLLVGRDLIGDAALDIDYAQHRFRLLPSGRLPFAGASAPLTLSPSTHLYTTELRLGAATIRPVIVDTGDGSAITVTKVSWKAAELTTPTTSAVAFGLAGPLTTALSIVPGLALGNLTAREVEVRVEPSGGFSEAIGVAGRIGTGFLQNYRVLLDAGAHRMVFQPGPGADRPPLKSTSGLLLGIAGIRLNVLHVMANGPAARSGWRAGEAICAVDGQAIGPDYAASPMAGWTVGTPGRVVHLSLCDGNVRDLTLASFY